MFIYTYALKLAWHVLLVIYVLCLYLLKHPLIMVPILFLTVGAKLEHNDLFINYYFKLLSYLFTKLIVGLNGGNFLVIVTFSFVSSES